MILGVVPDGSAVRRGDMLCRLDSSVYEDEVVRQRIVVEAARSDRDKAKLDLEVAEGALHEYRDGLLGQQLRDYESRISVGKSERVALVDRLEWLRRMLAKGYMPKAQLSKSEYMLQAAELDLTRTVSEFRNLRRFGAPAALRTHEGRVEGATVTFAYQSQRLRLLEDRLARFERQVELCTIRAPHDAVVLHANRPKKDFVVGPGALVRFNQELFYLADPSRVEVEVMLHETVVQRVRAGMPARVRLDDSTARVLGGRLVSVSEVLLRDQSRYSSDEVAYYTGRVEFDGAPREVRLGLSAEVELLTARRTGVLVVPVESLTVEGGHPACYVRMGDRIELREVVTGQATSTLAEVIEGLEEGEEVLLWRGQPPEACP
jgi:HlyD family secretion protein